MKFSSDIKVLSKNDQSKLFRPVDGDFSDVVNFAEKNISPKLDNQYIADDNRLKVMSIIDNINRYNFAEYPIETGWCFGGNKKMNGMEWHNSIEVIVACTDLVLILGDYLDIEDDTYDSRKSIALSLKKGECVELAPRTLHLAPLPVDEFFIATIILPIGTNSPLSLGIDGTLRAVNKWLLVHPENTKGISLGGKIGILGPNIEIINER